MTGGGASAEGDRPFVRRFDPATGETVELFRSSGEAYESVVTMLDESRVLTQRETPTEPPNVWLRDLVRRIAPQQITAFAHPYPEFASVQKQVLSYTRADGVPLSATLYLPAGYDAHARRPAPDVRLGLPGRVQGRRRCRAGERQPVPLHPHRRERRGAVRAARLRRARQRIGAHRRRRDGAAERHVHRTARRLDAGRHRRGRAARRGGPPRASASAGTATARS